MADGIRITGQGQIARNIVTGARRINSKLARAAFIEAEVEATECKRLVPVDTGTLEGTIHATGPEEKDGQIVVSVVAGGPAAPYAIYVHEDLEAFHDNGQAKFIEEPLRESARFMAARIARRARSL